MESRPVTIGFSQDNYSPICVSQCLYYLLNGAILEGFNLIFGTDVSLEQIFTTQKLETESAEGLLNITAVICSFIAGYDTSCT